ncbi:exonuclease domain-containing protein [Ruegeria sp. 6PALISEP08]|uniref:3'-5' exonuclease n=1 Tax=Ruegeria sp. 6PALISEP08 TaxID=1225660 RepID=UPI00067E8DAD|nr:exonuclease domain-containing protein [Ruegeria sp. 6PALISEP08]
MSDLHAEKFMEKMAKPGTEEESFFARRRALGLGVGVDAEGKPAGSKSLIFIDFEASSLSPESWPIEVGIAQLKERRVVVESKLVQPHGTWPLDDWSDKSAAVHNIPFSELETAMPADEVAHWLIERVGDHILVSDCPEFDQRWLDRLLSTVNEPVKPEIQAFDRIAWIAFSREEGVLAPGRIGRVYKTKTNRSTTHRAGADAADLAYAFRSGLPKTASPDFLAPMSDEDLHLWEGGDEETGV